MEVKLDKARKEMATLQGEREEKSKLLAEHKRVLPEQLQEAETVRRRAGGRAGGQAGRQAGRQA